MDSTTGGLNGLSETRTGKFTLKKVDMQRMKDIFGRLFSFYIIIFKIALRGYNFTGYNINSFKCRIQ